MASTFSSNLRLEKQTAGENSSTWGDKLNTVIDLIEEALTSMETITDTSGTVTLSTSNSVSDQARKSVLKITSALVGNLTIVVPDKNKHYLVWNASSGAYTVTVKTSAGTGVEVTQDTKRFVYCDATNVVDSTATLLASEITNTPAGTIAATTVQAAIDELDSEKAPKTGHTQTGDITMSGASIFDANASIAAHATTMDPWSLGNYVTCTGAAVTFTAMANAPQAGAEVELYMNAAHVFTDGAVFEVDGDANYTAVAGDRVLLRAKSTTVFTVHPMKKDGTSVVASTSKILQVVNTQSGAVATGTTVMVKDDTIPQNTEGDEYLSLAITPTSASNYLKFEVKLHFSHTNNGGTFIAALFQDSTASALAAGLQRMEVNNNPYAITMVHYMLAGTTSSTTFKVRAGLDVAGTTTINGSAGSRLLGGVAISSMTITEIAA